MRPRTAAAVSLAGLLAALAGGCGKKAESSAPPEYVAAADPPVIKPADKVVTPGAKRPADAPKTEAADPAGEGRGGSSFGTPPSPQPPAKLPSLPGLIPPGGTEPPMVPSPGGIGRPDTPAAPPGNPLALLPAPGGQPPKDPPPPNPAPGGQPPKDPAAKEPTKPKEPEWPSQVNGRGLGEYLKDLTDPDPFVRDVALRTIPNFGPPSRKGTGKMILQRMDTKTEKDPMVRYAAYACAAVIGFEDDNDMKEAVRILGVTADAGQSGGMARLHAIEALTAFGYKASGAAHFLIGAPGQDASYKTRQAVAHCLGRIAISEEEGPNPKALAFLAGTLGHDHCAAVRLEAMQSLVALGPPWLLPREGSKADKDRPPPKTDDKAAAPIVASIKKRLAKDPAKKDALIERDKQVEINARLAIMRFDPKEINDENLTAIARHLGATESGPRLQALAAFGMIGGQSAKKINDVVKVLDPEDPVVTSAALDTLAAMGVEGKPALDELRKLEKALAASREKRVASPEFRKLVAPLKPEELKQVIETLPEELLRKQTAATIEFLEKVKPGPPPAPEPPPKK